MINLNSKDKDYIINNNNNKKLILTNVMMITPFFIYLQKEICLYQAIDQRKVHLCVYTQTIKDKKKK